jgi:hydrogenase 3 maturation protease
MNSSALDIGLLGVLELLGIGHELRGDDAAGLRLARALQPLVAGNARVLVIEAGSAPESICGRLRRYRPDLVLLVDAAEMRAEAGTVRWLSWRDATGLSASTHTLPIHILASYLIIELGCSVALLGIQPCDICIGSSLTPPVRKAAVTTARALAEVLQQDTCPASGRPGH